MDELRVSAVQFESPGYLNRARLPVWCGAYLLGSVFTLLWFVALTGILQGARPVDAPEIQELELVAPQAAAPAPTVVPPVKPEPPAPKPVTPKTREPQPQPQPLVAPTTDASSPLAPVAVDPPPTAESPTRQASPTAAVETPAVPAPIKVEPIFRLTRRPDISAVKNMKNYPAAEQSRGREGKVIAEFIVDEHGAVRDIKILKSGGALFDQAVIDHLSKLTLTPPYIGERPVAARFPLEFVFKLN